MLTVHLDSVQVQLVSIICKLFTRFYKLHGNMKYHNYEKELTEKGQEILIYLKKTDAVCLEKGMFYVTRYFENSKQNLLIPNNPQDHITTITNN